MKFIDPLITFRYMGGNLPIHLIMGIYSLIQYINLSDFLGFAASCSADYPKIAYDDVFNMFIVHSLCVILIGIKSILPSNYGFLKDVLHVM